MSQSTSPLPDSSPKRAPVSRWLALVGVFAAAVGLVGFLRGITEPPAMLTPAAAPPAQGHHADLLPTPTYGEIDSTAWGPNRDWRSEFSKLQRPVAGLFEPVVRTAEMKDAALRDRLRTRAFDGAPPVIPHRVEQQSAASCLVCHGEGLQIADRVATRMSHAPFSSCNQCHVEAERGTPWESAPASPSEFVNEFTGRVRSGPGARAYVGAPPMIPHATFMREDCMSCHGLVARPGLRTTHPWLQNCRQCHVPSTESEPNPFGSQALADLAEALRSPPHGAQHQAPPE